MLSATEGPASRDAKHPLRVVVLCSQRAPGLRDLFLSQDRGHFSIVGVIASDAASAVLPDSAGMLAPCVVHDIREFYRREEAALTDLTLRPFYDITLAQHLIRFEAELVVLCGYIHILTAPVLNAFSNRVINIHDSDLLLLDPVGRPRYRGLRSTRDAILAGEPETRSTVHVVTPEVDVGPPLVRSWPFPVAPLVERARAWHAMDMLKAYAYAHREWMMRAAWGRMLSTAVGLIASNRACVSGADVCVNGQAGPITLERPREWRTELRRAVAGGSA